MVVEPHWHETYRSEHWYNRFRQRFFNRFAYRFSDPDDAFSQAIETLLFRKLPAAKPNRMHDVDNLVNVIFDRTVIDRCRSENGRLFVPRTLKSKGPIHTDLFYRYCVGRLNAAEISRDTGLSLSCVRHWIAWIDLKRACERPRLQIADAEPDEQMPAGGTDVSESPVEQELEIVELRAMVSQLLFGTDDNKSVMSSTLPRVELSADQILVLKMRYWEDMTLEAIARALHLKVHRIKYIHRTAIERLRKIITEFSLDVH